MDTVLSYLFVVRVSIDFLQRCNRQTDWSGWGIDPDGVKVAARSNVWRVRQRLPFSLKGVSGSVCVCITYRCVTARTWLVGGDLSADDAWFLYSAGGFRFPVNPMTLAFGDRDLYYIIATAWMWTRRRRHRHHPTKPNRAFGKRFKQSALNSGFWRSQSFWISQIWLPDGPPLVRAAENSERFRSVRPAVKLHEQAFISPQRAKCFLSYETM